MHPNAQSQRANPQRCWNWFKSTHQGRAARKPQTIPVPTIVFHGDADATVQPANGRQDIEAAAPAGRTSTETQALGSSGRRMATRVVHRDQARCRPPGAAVGHRTSVGPLAHLRRRSGTTARIRLVFFGSGARFQFRPHAPTQEDARRAPGAHVNDEKMQAWCLQEYAALRAEKELSELGEATADPGAAEMYTLAATLRARADRLFNDLLDETGSKSPTDRL